MPDIRLSQMRPWYYFTYTIYSKNNNKKQKAKNKKQKQKLAKLYLKLHSIWDSISYRFYLIPRKGGLCFLGNFYRVCMSTQFISKT